MNKIFYSLDNNANILSFQLPNSSEALSTITVDRVEGTDYILGDIGAETDIRTLQNYIDHGLYNENNIPRWKNNNGSPIFKQDSDLIDLLRPIKLAKLRSNYQIALNALTQSENKAKTLMLSWIDDGSSGDKPQYWLDWRTGRDSIDSNYQTKKAYILDESRTYAELESYDVSL